MKKTRRLLCMSLAVVMLLGAIPAQAATPMTAAASLIALPLSGKLFTALPVSGNISKALTVKEIESTYSTEAKSAPTSAPVEQTTFATTANPAPANRLPDGTTGATVGLVGKTADITGNELKASPKNGGSYATWTQLDKYGTFAPSDLLRTYGTAAILIDPTKCSPAKLAGATIPAGILVDVYVQTPGITKYTFLCQYDTRDGNPLTIPMEPFAANKTRKAAAPAKKSYTDVNPGDWYYEAVIALNESGLIHTVFDLDPNDSFKPNELLTSGEVEFIYKRLRGEETTGLVLPDTSNRDTTTMVSDDGYVYAVSSSATRLHVLNDIMVKLDTYNVTPLAQAKATINAADANAIDGMARTYATDAQHGHRGHCNLTWDENYARVRDILTRAGELNLVRTPGTPETIDFDARVTRAEFCVMLYRAGLTEFGCCAQTNLKKK